MPFNPNQANNENKKDYFAFFKKFLNRKNSAPTVPNKEIISEYSKTTQSPGDKNKIEVPVPSAQDHFSDDVIVFDTNLIKNEVTAFFNWKKNYSYLFYCIFVPLVFLAIMYGGLIYWQNSEQITSDALTSDINTQNDMIRIVEIEVEKALTFQKKIMAGQELLQKHIRWSNLFKLLEDYTLADVSYSTFLGGTDGSYDLSASAKKGFYVAAEQIKLFNQEKKYIISADSDGGSKKETEEGSEVSFSIKLKVSPTIFTSDYANGAQ